MYNSNQNAGPAQRFCAFSKTSDARHCKTMMLRAEEEIISRIADAVTASARASMKANKSVHLHQAMADAVINQLLHPSATSAATTGHQPALIAVLDKHEYSDGGRLIDTFGNSYTLDQAANLIMADTGWLVIADRNANLVANFQIRNRFASENQRMAAIIEQVTCAVPGCHQLSKDGQIHHIQAYKHGGPTRQDNLTGVCRVHNGLNDDDPNRPAKYGRIERDSQSKRPGWKPPGREDILLQEGPLADYDGRALVNRALQRTG